MPLFTSLAALSQTPASNAPDGSVDAPSTIDDQLRLLASYVATLRDGKGASAEVSLASAATCDIGAQNSPFVQITGTTTITSFGSNLNGPRFLRFASALTLTHNASSLILPGGANITTAAGDTCIAIPIAGGWYVTQYIANTVQTWNNLTGSRAAGTTYTNNTGRAIQVYAQVRGTVSTSTVSAQWTINGVSGVGGFDAVAGSTPSNTSVFAIATVPPGATYSLVVVQASVANWRELR